MIQKEMYFRPLHESDLKEIEAQHKEWFPLDYPKSFYTKILNKPNIITVGCFIELDIDEEAESNDQEDEELKQDYINEIMLGSIISRIKTGNDELQDILVFEEDDRLWKESYIQYYLSGIMCKNIFGGEQINDES